MSNASNIQAASIKEISPFQMQRSQFSADKILASVYLCKINTWFKGKFSSTDLFSISSLFFKRKPLSLEESKKISFCFLEKRNRFTKLFSDVTKSCPNMATTKTSHTATVRDSAPNETGTTGHQSAVCDLNSTFAQASIDMNTKTMNLSLANCKLAVFGQCSTAHHSDCHLLRKRQEEPDLGRADCHVEKIRPSGAEESSIVQCFSRPGVSVEERQQKPNTSSAEILLDVEPSLPVIKKQGLLNGPQCEEILKNLELLQDNGKFKHHKHLFNFCLERCVEKGNKGMKEKVNEHMENIVKMDEHCNKVLKKFQQFQERGRLKEDEQLFSLYSRLCTKQEYADIEVALILEQGVSFMYNKKLSKSKIYLTSVIELAKHCKLRNPNILIARAYILLATNCSCRKPRNFSTFLEYLRRSEVLLQNHESPEDWAEMYYKLGIVWLNFMSTVPDDDRNAKVRKEMREKAKSYYEWAIAICKKDPRSRVQHKRLTYCHLGLAALLLDCSSTVARTRIKVIPSQDLKAAKRHLDIVEHQLGDIPPGTRVQILKRRSDHYYRQGPGMYQVAEETAQDAFEMARSHGFNTELESLRKRIEFLDQLSKDAVCRERIRLLDDGDTSTSGSSSRFETSCSEPDENQNSLKVWVGTSHQN